MGLAGFHTGPSVSTDYHNSVVIKKSNLKWVQGLHSFCFACTHLPELRAGGRGRAAFRVIQPLHNFAPKSVFMQSLHPFPK